MKEGKKYILLGKLRWLCLVVVMLVGVHMEILAGQSDYYFYVTATAEGNGKVYVDQSDTAPAESNYVENFSVPDGPVSNDDKNTVTLSLWAQPDPGYKLNYWSGGNSNNSSAIPTKVTETISSRGKNNAPTFSYTAHFVKREGVVQAESEKNEMGTATYSPNNNKIDEEVTLTATPLGGRLFLGWTKDNGTDFVSTNTPYTFTIGADDIGTYYAHFSDVAAKGYVRLQNKSTGKFISFYGDGTPSGTIQDGLAFSNSLKMISASEAQGNPETVFLKSSHEYKSNPIGADLSVHGVSYSTLVAPQYLLTFDNSGHIYTTVTINGNTTNRYLCDNGSGWLSMSAMDSPDASAEWYVYDLSGSSAEGAFGANTKAKYTDGEGKYYTTMFADFAYQCSDGVKAYYLPAVAESYDADKKVVHFTEVPNGKVPANMAVVLECNAVQNDFASNKTVNNILKPILPESAPSQIVSEGSNILKGFVSVNGSTVTNNMTTMYVLSYDNHLGFYHSTKGTMSPNKAYLDVGTIAEQNNIEVTSTKFAFDRKADIDNPDEPTTETDLKGDMNNDGKITITDVMILVNMVANQ